MKKILAVILSLVIMISLCACTTTDNFQSYSNDTIHIERHYLDNGNLFCIKQTNLETGAIIATYFYWEYDDHGRRTLSRTESITFDKNGQVISHESIPSI